MTTHNENPFQTGEVVQLKSGGPQMTIKDAGNEHQTTQVVCVWFNSQLDLREAAFHIDMLLRDGDVDDNI